MNKKRGITLKINLTNRWLYTLIVIGILTIIGVSVYATTDTSKGWHPSSQIEGLGSLATKNSVDLSDIQACDPGEILQVSGGSWGCVEMPSVSGADDTNAGTICSEATEFLAGDGNCKIGYLDADGVDTDTHGSLSCNTRGASGGKSCNTRCSNYGEICVSVADTRGRSRTCEYVPSDYSAGYQTCRCCRIV